MALLICFKKREDNFINWSKKAIYLDQDFYETFFQYCKSLTGPSFLKQLVSLGYGEEYVISCSELEPALKEIEWLMEVKSFKHPQVLALENVFHTAIAEKKELAIAGDMHPTLSD